jgi:hypothetical protein
MATPERWYPEYGRPTLLRVMTAVGLVLLGYAVYRVVAIPHDSTGDAFTTGAILLQAVCAISLGRGWRRTYVEVDDDGVTVAIEGPPRTIPWTDIAELRPHVPYSWATHLVIIRRDGERIDLPLPADHRGLLDRWEAVAPEHEPPVA